MCSSNIPPGSDTIVRCGSPPPPTDLNRSFERFYNILFTHFHISNKLHPFVSSKRLIQNTQHEDRNERYPKIQNHETYIDKIKYNWPVYSFGPLIVKRFCLLLKDGRSSSSTFTTIDLQRDINRLRYRQFACICNQIRKNPVKRPRCNISCTG